jgi:NAD+ kinase
VEYNTVNRVELDRQHLAEMDLVIAAGGDGTVLSAAHMLDYGTLPLLGVNTDPITDADKDTKKKTDERRSHGALCLCTANNMDENLPKVLYGEVDLSIRTRIQCIVKSTFSETRLVPALNDLLIANPSPAAVSRFRMGFLVPLDMNMTNSLNGSSLEERETFQYLRYGTVTRFLGQSYDTRDSLNIWSSGMWVCSGTGSTAAMAAAGGKPMELDTKNLQFLIREHMVEKTPEGEQEKAKDNGYVLDDQQLFLRWNSQKGTIFIDGSHLTHNLELGDEILINNKAPPLQIFLH